MAAFARYKRKGLVVTIPLMRLPARLLLIAFLLWLAACGSALVPPILLESGSLVYPEAQKNAEIQGWVLVAYDVDQTGEVNNVRVADSYPKGVFDQAAIEFVRTWRFQPQKRAGTPEAVPNMQSRISFTLDHAASSYDSFIR